MPNVDLGKRFEEFIEAQVKNGRFQNAAEVVRAGLRLLEDQELARAERKGELARAIDEALDEPGEDRALEDVFARLEQEFAKDAETRRRDS
jgi:antitoxin ParD1/3/4